MANAKAAIDAVAGMGIADPARVAVMGHSYGAFMTVNLLAHSDLFAAGIARSGAYNRSLTPFGFQSEERTYWEAQPVYQRMSPFNYAGEIDEPLLMVHGDADNTPGRYNTGETINILDEIDTQIFHWMSELYSTSLKLG